MELVKNKDRLIKTAIGCGIIFLIVLAYLFIEYRAISIHVINSNKEVSANHFIRGSLTELLPGDVIEQEIRVSKDSFCSIQLEFDTFGRKNNCTVDVVLYNEANEVVSEWSLDASILVENYRFFLDEDIEVNDEALYRLKITSKDSSPGNAIGIKSSGFDSMYGQELKVNGQAVEDDICFTVMGRYYSGLTLLKAFVLFAVISLLAVMVIINISTLKIEQVFVVAFLLTGFLYTMILPPYSAPDEAKHFATVYYYTNPAGAEELLDDRGKTIVRETDLVLNHRDNYKPNASTYEVIKKELTSPEVSLKSAGYFDNPLSVPPTSYIPQEIGGLIGRIFGLSGVLTLYLMKVCMLIAAAVLGYFTIKIAPVGKMIFFALYFTPMVLALMTSANYDSSVDSLAFLIIAYILKLRIENEKVGIKEYVPLLLLSLIMVPIKVVYILVIFAVFVIPVSKFGGRKNYLLMNGGLILINAVVLLAIRISSIRYIVVEGGGGTANVHWTLGQILSNIPRACIVFAQSFFKEISFYYDTMIGQRLGWLELMVPSILILCFSLVIFMCVFSKTGSEKEYEAPLWERVIYVLIFLAVYCGVMLALWLDFTSAGSEVIEGVQGRYFIPALPLLLLALKGKGFVFDERIIRWVPVALVSFNIFTLGAVFEQIVCR